MVKIRGSQWEPDFQIHESLILGLPDSARLKFDGGGRGPSLMGVGPFQPIITHKKGPGKFTKSAEGAHHYNVQWLKYNLLDLVAQW
jgi:hypothetical protein